MANLSTLASLTTSATSLSNLILVSPQKTVGYQPTPGATQANGGSGTNPPALLFHYEGEQTVTIESDITDHYVEDNTAIQDQIALRPEVITTQGFIGELNNVAPPALSTLQTAANKLTTISPYAPALSVSSLLAYNTAFQLYQVAQNATNTAISAWSTITGSSGENVIGSNGLGGAFNASTGSVSGYQNQQQTYFQQFYGYWRNRTLFTVQTPWAVFKNMAIRSLRAIQDAETNVITDFEVSFKMIRFASTVGINTNQVSLGRLQSQASALVNNGTSTPIPSISLSQGLTNMGVV